MLVEEQSELLVSGPETPSAGQRVTLLTLPCPREQRMHINERRGMGGLFALMREWMSCQSNGRRLNMRLDLTQRNSVRI